MGEEAHAHGAEGQDGEAAAEHELPVGPGQGGGGKAGKHNPTGGRFQSHDLQSDLPF